MDVVVPLVDEGLGNSADVVDLGGGGALVVDPQRDPRPCLAELGRRGLAARFVVETHLHAGFVSGGRELAASGATPSAPRSAYRGRDPGQRRDVAVRIQESHQRGAAT